MQQHFWLNYEIARMKILNKISVRDSKGIALQRKYAIKIAIETKNTNEKKCFLSFLLFKKTLYHAVHSK